MENQIDDVSLPAHVVALMRAIEIAGGQAALARGIAQYLNRPKFKQQAVSYWLRKQIRIEAEYWPAIDHVTGGLVTAADLRPETFSRLQNPAAA